MDSGAIVVKRYEIIKTIGSGGMGDVYQARRLADNSFVAIKILREDLIKDKEAVTRFRREARAASALRSPHAARILDVGELDNKQPFIVMEFLEGWDLMTEIDNRGALPPVEAVSYVAQACHAMIEAHDLGIIHRDLKPPNLFLAIEGPRRVVKVLDFGISKVNTLTDGHVTSTQMSFGSPLYMSPEQIRSTKLVDARSDVWSLGVILYETLTGEPPFMGESAGALAVVISVEGHMPASQRKPGVPPGLDDVISGALQKDPKKRYQSVKEFLRAIEDYLPRDESGHSSTLIDPPKDLPPALQRRLTPPMHGQQITQGAVTAPPQTVSMQHHASANPFSSQSVSGGSPAHALLHQQGAMNPPITAFGVTAPPSAPYEHQDTGRTPQRTLVMPPRITLGPATTDPPVSLGHRKERAGLILAAVLIPLGALAFGFAIWLYAKKGETRSVSHATSAAQSASAASRPIDVTPATAAPGTATPATATPPAQSDATTAKSTAKSDPTPTSRTGRPKTPKTKPTTTGAKTGPLLPQDP